jgi:hypothetical protein
MMTTKTWSLEDLQSASREIFDEPKKCQYSTLEVWGIYVACDENETLWWVAMDLDGNPDMYKGSIDWGEMTAPDEELLEVLTRDFGIDFDINTFAGR